MQIQKGWMASISNSNKDDQKQITKLRILKFNTLIKTIQNSNWMKFIQEKQKLYNINLYNIDKLNPHKVMEIYMTISNKFYSSEKNKRCWYENQLKIFIWILLNYSNLIKKQPQNFLVEDWEFLSSLFLRKSPETCQFQFKIIQKNHQKSEKWKEDEEQLLQLLVQQFQYSNKWNQIAKELFIRSKKLYFRPAKQCRERWNNYLDPTKKKGNWTLEEDRILMKNVMEKGKKWAHIAKLLKNKRTQHMVKNRFKSLVIKYRKWSSNQIEENKICQQIQRYLCQIHEQIQKQDIVCITKEDTIQLNQQCLPEVLPIQQINNNWQNINSKFEIEMSGQVNMDVDNGPLEMSQNILTYFGNEIY